jgi:hypothetical protein
MAAGLNNEKDQQQGKHTDLHPLSAFSGDHKIAGGKKIKRYTPGSDAEEAEHNISQYSSNASSEIQERKKEKRHDYEQHNQRDVFFDFTLSRLPVADRLFSGFRPAVDSIFRPFSTP